ncbi:MAG: hypothetical protein KAK00_07110 [Nanoarchaeota archaeon]|nr:hypothetical protein [Nanoarchaeota archaeon]
MNKKGQFKQITILFIFLFIAAIISLAASKTKLAESQIDNSIEPRLASAIGSKSVFTDPYLGTYLKNYKNLAHVKFEKLSKKGYFASLKDGNIKDNIEGFILNNRKYAIHLVGCNQEEETCNFRINGMLVKGLSQNGKNTIDLDDTYSIKINSIRMNYCDNRRFCDYTLQSYDKVELEVVER